MKQIEAIPPSVRTVIGQSSVCVLRWFWNQTCYYSHRLINQKSFQSCSVAWHPFIYRRNSKVFTCFTKLAFSSLMDVNIPSCIPTAWFSFALLYYFISFLSDTMDSRISWSRIRNYVSTSAWVGCLLLEKKWNRELQIDSICVM